MFVAPEMIDSKLLFSDTWKGFAGPAVQLSRQFGDTSGRFVVAAVIARVFPAHRTFFSRVIAEGIETAANFPMGPYPEDRLHYLSKEMVEYETPPDKEGLGTRSRLQKNGNPIVGAAALSDEELNLTLLSVRLPPGSERVARAVVLQVEREVEEADGKN
ncbi:MAG: hypothetical protein M3Y50_10355 [Acidobacteriota bacterium]|nr:hypothetical protein [Acidobacteriota bacterium]